MGRRSLLLAAVAISLMPASPRAARGGTDRETYHDDGEGLPEDVRLDIGARVAIRDTWSKDSPRWENEFGISRARLSVDYFRGEAFRSQVEFAVLEGDLQTRDVYVDVRLLPGLRFRLGKFKRPMSAVALESGWILPVVDRGILADDVVTPRYEVPIPLGRRGTGAQLAFRRAGTVQFDTQFGVFNGELPQPIGDAPAVTDERYVNLWQDVFFRLQLGFGPYFKVGSSVALIVRSRQPGYLDRAPLASADVALIHPALGAWAEAYAGRHIHFDGMNWGGQYRAARAIVAPRLGLHFSWLDRLEPFAIASWQHLTDDRPGAYAVELGTGVSLQIHEEWRIHLQYQRIFQGEQYPSTPSMQVQAQLEARFELSIPRAPSPAPSPGRKPVLEQAPESAPPPAQTEK